MQFELTLNFDYIDTTDTTEMLNQAKTNVELHLDNDAD